VTGFLKKSESQRFSWQIPQISESPESPGLTQQWPGSAVENCQWYLSGLHLCFATGTGTEIELEA
jgi:hypothetical protein